MKSFLLKISSPEGDVFSGNAVNLSVRGTEGELAVMAGHVPFVTAVKPCDCKIELESGEEIFSMQLTAATKAQAKRFCERWPAQAASIYQSMMERLGETEN